MVEHSAVNRRVVGSSPTRGVSYNIRPRGQEVKTSPFHGGNRGPNPLGVIVIDCKASYYVRNCPLNEDAVAFEVCGLRSGIFCQIVRKDRRLADARQGLFVRYGEKDSSKACAAGARCCLRNGPLAQLVRATGS